MDKLIGKKQQNETFERDLFDLVFTDALPWIAEIDNDQNNWAVCSVSSKGGQVIVSIMHARLNCFFSALICCENHPEILAVSFADNKLGQLNPYIEGGEKLESDLDGLSCWNMLAISIKAEKGAQAVRYLRNGVEREALVNRFGIIEIVDWNDRSPVEEFLSVKIDGKWRKPAVSVVPFTINHFCICWRNAVANKNGLKNRWNEWITAAFAELGGNDRAQLQHALMEIFSKEADGECCQAFRSERRRFLNRGTQELKKIFESV